MCYVIFLTRSKTGGAEEKENNTAKALEISLQYNFVTPLTSMVVTKPESDDPPLVADKLTEGKLRIYIFIEDLKEFTALMSGLQI